MSELRQPDQFNRSLRKFSEDTWFPTCCLFNCLSGFKNLIKRVASKADLLRSDVSYYY